MRTVIAVGTVLLGIAGAVSTAEAGHGGFGGGGGHFGGGSFGGAHFGGAHFAARSFGGGGRGAHLGGVRYYNHVGSWANHGGHTARNVISHHQRFVAHSQSTHGQQLSALHNSERPSRVGNLAQAARGQFAHAQLAALPGEQFHGLNHFNPNGFNRNAFGKQVAWNSWGHNHWGPGWNHWGRGWGFWSGPVFWPFFWGDFLTSWWWPDAYYDPFWYYGPDRVLASVFWPGPGYGTYGHAGLYDIYGYGDYVGHDANYGYRDPIARKPTDQSAPPGQTIHANSLAETCSGLAPGVTDLPVDRIEDAFHPTGDQIAALENVKSAASRAAEALKASCLNEAPLTPVSRLDAMEKRFSALVEAVEIVRAPLDRFYDSLSDQQKQRFEALGGNSQAEHSNGLGSICSQESQRFTELPLQRIEQTIQPSEVQRHGLDELKAASLRAAGELKSSCPTEALHTRSDRLAAMNKRLDAMIKAVETVRPSLQTFYASLSDEQKARFNVIGHPQDQSASKTAGPAD
jgi:LTXXQ motif family protein